MSPCFAEAAPAACGETRETARGSTLVRQPEDRVDGVDGVIMIHGAPYGPGDCKAVD